MKKLISLILALFITVSLCACVTFRMKINDIEPGDVVSIEIYRITDPENRSWWKKFYEIYDPVYTLAEYEKKPFLEDLGKIQFGDTIILIAATDPGFSYGEWVARVNMTNGNSRFISCGGHGETIDKDGNFVESDHYGCDDEEWNELISKYLPKDIPNRNNNAGSIRAGFSFWDR